MKFAITVVLIACLSLAAHATTLTVSNLEAYCKAVEWRITCDSYDITDIDVNTFSSWQNDIEWQIWKVAELIFTSTGLTDLSPEIFTNLTYLAKLHVKNHYGLTALRPDLFNGLSVLEDLDLSGNNIRSLDSNIFQGLTNLRKLTIQFNPITELSVDLFKRNNNIEELNLSYNQLEVLSDGIFDSLTNLNILNLNGNFLKSVSSNLFKFNFNLQTLGLYYNNIETIDDGALKHLTNLRDLDLSSNQLNSLPVSELFCLDLVSLNLCQNTNLQYVSRRMCNNVAAIKSAWRYYMNLSPSVCPFQANSAYFKQSEMSLIIALGLFTFIFRF